MYGFIIPATGWTLLSKLLAGATLTFSRVMVGSGQPAEGVEPSTLTDLVDPVAPATSTVPYINVNTCSFIVEYRSDLNGGLQQGFYLREFGVFAIDPDVGEVLLYYGCLGDYPQYVAPNVNGAIDIRRFPVSIVLTDNVSVQINYPAIAWMTSDDVKNFFYSIGIASWLSQTAEQLAQHNISPESHQDLRDTLDNLMNGITDAGGDPSEALYVQYAKDAWPSGSIDRHIKDFVRHLSVAVLGGTAANYTGTLSPAPEALAEGMHVMIVPHVDNEAGASLTLNGLGTYPLYVSDGSRAAASAFKARQLYIVAYQNAGWRLVSGGSDWINPIANVDGTWYRGTVAPTGTMRANYSGDLWAARLFNAYLADYAEHFNCAADVEAGDVIAQHPNRDDFYVRATAEHAKLVVGVLSKEYAQCIGSPGDPEKPIYAIGMAGRLPVKVVGAVRRGDLLIPSNTPGAARAVNIGETHTGCVLGKALEDKTTEDQGIVRMLIMMA